jgi:leucyl-tRNA synthetase
MSHPARPPRVTRRADIDSNKLQLARRFRQAPTEAEAAAWQILRDRALFGLKFRRQQILAGFIVDFYCPSLRLVLELDGGVHDDPSRRDHDQARSQVLRRLSVRVLRVPNHAVHEQALRELLAPYAPTQPGR